MQWQSAVACVQHDCLGQLVSTETEHMHTNNIQSLAIVLDLLLLNTQTVQKKLGQPGLLLVMRKVIRTLSSADKLSCSQCPSFRKEGKKEAKRQMEGEIGSNGLSSDFHERERERERATHFQRATFHLIFLGISANGQSIAIKKLLKKQTDFLL